MSDLRAGMRSPAGSSSPVMSPNALDPLEDEKPLLGAAVVPGMRRLGGVRFGGEKPGMSADGCGGAGVR